MLSDLDPRGLRIFRQQLLCRQQHARRAEATLQGIAAVKCGLQIGNRSAFRHPLDRLDVLAVRLHGQHQAAAQNPPPHANRAGTADAMFAARTGAGQTLTAQEIDKVLTRFDICGKRLSIQGQGNFHVSPRAASRRDSSTRA